MAVGGGEGKSWIVAFVAGTFVCGGGYAAHHWHMGPDWLAYGLLAVGGMAVIFGACQAMIKSVEGMGERAGLNPFVAGTLAGLASNLPEIAMLGFVVAQAPRVAFVVVMLTLHVGALVFGIYSHLLPRDEGGAATLPEPLVRLSTDLYACAGAIFLVLGGLMVTMRAFASGDHLGESLGAADLYALGGVFLFVQAVAIIRLIQRFSGSREDVPVPARSGDGPGVDVEPETEEEGTSEDADDKPKKKEKAGQALPTVGAITGFGLLGIGGSVLGGHAVGDFAGALVDTLNDRGYPEMIGAIILSIFACSGVYLMIVTAHTKKMYDVALANASGSITQVPFVVLPVVLIMMAAFAQLGIGEVGLEGGGVLPIDLETTSVVLLAFPPMLILWKSIADDGRVNWLETASMLSVFALTLYMLAQHG